HGRAGHGPDGDRHIHRLRADGARSVPVPRARRGCVRVRVRRSALRDGARSPARPGPADRTADRRRRFRAGRGLGLPHPPCGQRVALRQYAAHWFNVAGPHREKLYTEAMELAVPSLSWTTLGAMARAGGRVVAAVGPDGLADIFRTASDARKSGERLPMETAIEHAQNLVAAGGPAYVKLGQFIASARGLLPDGWVEAFAWCRDEVPPLRPGVAEARSGRTFGHPPHALF